MSLAPRRLLVGVSRALLLLSSALYAADPPNIPVAHTLSSVTGCTPKGIINLNLTDLHTDVASIRSPEMRLHVARLGGNVLLVLPSASDSVLPTASERNDAPPRVRQVVSASVYACPATKLPEPPRPKP